VGGAQAPFDELGGENLLDAGLRYARRGWKISPVDGNKEPLTPHGFKDATTDEAVITAWAKRWPGANWALAVGDGLLVIDLDNKRRPTGIQEFERLQGCKPEEFIAPRVRTGTAGVHLYTDPGDRDFKNSRGTIAPGIDTRASNVGYALLPSGNGWYRWETSPDTPLPATPVWVDVTLRNDEINEIHGALTNGRPFIGFSEYGEILLASACEAIEFAPNEQQEHTLNSRSLIIGHYIAGGLLEHDATVEKLIAAGMRMINYDEKDKWTTKEVSKKVKRAVRDGMKKPMDGEEGFRAVVEAARLYHEDPQYRKDTDEFIMAVRAQDGADYEGDYSTTDETGEETKSKEEQANTAPALVPVDIWAKFEPPALPIHLLPKTIAKFAVEESTLIGADPAGLAISALATCAAAIRDCIKIKPKRHHPWTESARLWAAIVGPPSVKKTPTINAATRELKRMDSELCRDYAEGLKHWKNMSADDKKTNPKPKQLRVLLDDVTVEASQEIFRDSPDGVLFLHDELAAFFGGMDKYGSGRGANSNRAFWNRAYNGDSFTFDRVTRGSGHIPNLGVSLLGGIQPEILQKISADTIDDGLIQRIVLIMLKPASKSQDREYPVEAIDYNTLVRRLREKLSGTGAPFQAPVEFSNEAMAIRERLEERHLELTQTFDTLNRKLAAHIGKYDGLFVRMCLLWHCIEAVEEMPEKDWVPRVLSGNTAQRVAEFLHSFLLPHAISIYTSVFGLAENHDEVADTAGYILAHRLNSLTNRVMARGSRAMRRVVKDQRKLANVYHQLEAMGWLRQVLDAHGRPLTPPIFMVVPEDATQLITELDGWIAAKRGPDHEQRLVALEVAKANAELDLSPRVDFIVESELGLLPVGAGESQVILPKNVQVVDLRPKEDSPDDDKFGGSCATDSCARGSTKSPCSTDCCAGWYSLEGGGGDDAEG
jgi:hypothetical protein